MIDSDNQQSSPIDTLTVAAHMFSLQTLNHSFELVRQTHPALALTIQNLTAEYHNQSLARCQDCWISINLDVNTVSEIVCALSATAERAAADTRESMENRIAIHQTLLDWLMYAQSFLDDDNHYSETSTRGASSWSSGK